MSESVSYKPNDYADILKLISDNNYAQDKHIKVKKNEHLYVLKYIKSQLTTENIDSLGLFRSIVANKDGEIVSFAPPKSIDYDVFSQSNEYNNCYIQHFPEGTMINVFNFNILKNFFGTRRVVGTYFENNLVKNFIVHRRFWLNSFTGIHFLNITKY